MDHSLGALLAQNDDENHEHAICYLSRTMIGQSTVTTNRKGMLSVGLRCPEDVTQPDGVTHSCYLQS